jgi:hypothetical protein
MGGRWWWGKQAGRLSPIERSAHVPWYTPELARMRVQLGELRRDHGSRAQCYLEMCRMYKARCKHAKRDAHRQHRETLHDMSRYHGKAFWREYLGWRRGSTVGQQPAAVSWVTYGSQLYAAPAAHMEVPAQLQELVPGVNVDVPCTPKETTAALDKLRSGRAEDVHMACGTHSTTT